MLILYVDDDADDTEIFCEALRSVDPQIRCVTASDGAAAVEAMRRQCPDFIFLDYRMPRLNGKEVLERLQGNDCFHRSNVVMYYTYMMETDMEECRRLGVSHCIRKSGAFEALCSELTKILRRTTT